MALLAFSATSLTAKKADRPNVLIILSDDQGWGDVGFNGCTEIPTPNLDKLAEDGISFQAGYASHPYCSPSRAGLLSGRYQQRFGHENNLPYTTATADDGLPLDEIMISEVLQKNGYKTCAIGKWHLGDSTKFWPNKRGFDDWYGFWGGGLSLWGDLKRNDDPYSGILRDGKPVPKEEISYLTDNFSEEAVNYIDAYSKEDEPFFMYLAYNAPHSPFHATREYLNELSYIEYGDRRVYGAMVHGMDKGIGKVIEKLKETGEFENTLIFFYSDNGGAANGGRNFPFRGHKGMMFEGGIRVPFLVHWPKGIEGGYRYEKAITALDIFPTILAATGIKDKKQKHLDGVNLLPYLNGKKKDAPHDDLYWRYSDGAGYAVRKADMKLVYSGYTERFFLFDLEQDPYEMNDLSEKMPEKVSQLNAMYKEWTKGTVSSKWQDPHAANVLKEQEALEEAIKKASAGERK